MYCKPVTRGERVLIVLVLGTLLPIAGVVVAFVLFGQGTPTLGN
jgi:hypothetical protein